MKSTLFVFCLFLMFVSCTTNQNSDGLDKYNFYALTVGNSWVYKNYKFNRTNNTYDEISVIDSLSIISSETINGNVFYKVRRWTTGNENNITFCNPNGEHIEFLRDSIGYLIDEKGQIKHTYVNYDERLVSENDWGNVYEILQNDIEAISVKSGTFNCISTKRYAKDKNGQLLIANDFFYYSDGFGLIYDTSSFVSSDTPTIIRRLDSYIIN